MSEAELERLLESIKNEVQTVTYYEYEPERYCVCLQWGPTTLYLTSACDYVQFLTARKTLEWLRLPPVTAHGESRETARKDTAQ